MHGCWAAARGSPPSWADSGRLDASAGRVCWAPGYISWAVPGGQLIHQLGRSWRIAGPVLYVKFSQTPGGRTLSGNIQFHQLGRSWWIAGRGSRAVLIHQLGADPGQFHQLGGPLGADPGPIARRSCATRRGSRAAGPYVWGNTPRAWAGWIYEKLRRQKKTRRPLLAGGRNKRAGRAATGQAGEQ